MKKTEMRRILSLLTLGILTLSGRGISQDQNFQQFAEAQDQAFRQYSEMVSREYADYLKADSIGFASFLEEIETIWGDKVAPGKHEWVEYSRDKTSRFRVDFESGKMTVEVVIPLDDSKRKEETVVAELEKTAKAAVVSRGNAENFAEPGKVVTPIESEPVLQNRIRFKDGETVTAKTVRKKILQSVKNHSIQMDTVTTKNGTRSLKGSVQFHFAPDYLRKRAERYQGSVNRWSARFQVEPALVWAVIHTESYYNPKARSKAPAYGLMQLVPHTGARDAYRYVYNEDRLIKGQELYNPDFNIQLGTAYLGFLQEKIYGNVKDPDSRRAMVIAAYNTGFGNVNRTLSGSSDTKETVKTVNSMNAEEVRRKLTKRLPYRETRSYLQKVLGLLESYRNWR